MTKPTGRPRGRPKTKEYVTLMARVDIALADRVKRYAAAHRQPIAVVIRDALTLLMEEYPSGADLSGPHRLAAHEFLSDRYESPLDTLLGETDSTGLEELLSDTNEEVIETLLSGTNSGPHIVSGRNTDMPETRAVTPPSTRPAQASDKKEALAALPSDAKEDVPPLLSDRNVPAFDPSTYVLGKLCPRGHDYYGTGQSLRRLPKFVCLECEAERARERRQAKRPRA